MIPKRMAFYWEGGPMSWLRLQTLDTFTRLHPNWELIRLKPEGDPSLPLDTRSDLARWLWLAGSAGGWFMDTDIIWLRPIPEDLQEAETALTIDSGTAGPNGRHFAMGVAGGDWASRLLLQIVREANRSVDPGDHQSAGTKAIARAWESGVGIDRVTNLPGKLLYPWGHSQRALDNAWDPEIELPEDLLGLHWSGGHPSSRAAELWVTAEWARHSRVPVAQALRRAYA